MILGQRPERGSTKRNPFPRGTGGSNSFRIPALVTLSDGTLVAAADARWDTNYDGGGLDTVTARSEDNGATWDYSFANYLGDNGNRYNGRESTCFIDPALAVAGDDRVWMLVDLYPYGVALNGDGNTQPSFDSGFDDMGRLRLSGDDHASCAYCLEAGNILRRDGSAVPGYRVDGYFNLYRDGEPVSNLFFSDSPFRVARTGFLYMTNSRDGGRTWSEPMLVPAKTEQERVCLVAPGRGLTTRSGRVVFPVYSYAGSAGSQKTGLLYSDDGIHWIRSSCFTGAEWSSESAAVELEDEKLRLFFRNGTCRLCYADYDLVTDAWSEPVKLDIPVNSNCQLSAISYSKKWEGKQVILVSCPAGPNAEGSDQSGGAFRCNGRIFCFAAEENRTLRQLAVIPVTDREEQFLYSCLTEQKDGRLGLLYEDEAKGWGVGGDCYCTVTFRSFDLQVETGLRFD